MHEHGGRNLAKVPREGSCPEFQGRVLVEAEMRWRQNEISGKIKSTGREQRFGDTLIARQPGLRTCTSTNGREGTSDLFPSLSILPFSSRRADKTNATFQPEDA